MTAVCVVRPVVRSYPGSVAERAAAHLRRGGHAVVWDEPRRARLVVPFFADDDIDDFGWWAILDIRKQRYRIIPTGPLRGFIETLVPPDRHGIVRRRVDRDKAHRGSMHRVRLDCLACGACCHDNEVVLDEADVERIAARRADLVRPPYVRRKQGKLMVRLTGSIACCHLKADNQCNIYAMRPAMCSEFPVGSECCLSARADEFGLWDGLAPSL